MTEMERFEYRLAAALERLADEVPTAVDAAEVARAVAAGNARSTWLPGPLAGALPRASGLSPSLRYALAPVLLLLLVLGLFALAQRMNTTPWEGLLTGRMECASSSWTDAPGPVVLECAIDLPDRTLAGAVSIALGGATDVNVLGVRGGTIDLDASGARWTGEIELTVTPNGMVVGDAALTGAGGAAGRVLHVHHMSADGIRWGLFAWIETSR